MTTKIDSRKPVPSPIKNVVVTKPAPAVVPETMPEEALENIKEDSLIDPEQYIDDSTAARGE